MDNRDFIEKYGLIGILVLIILSPFLFPIAGVIITVVIGAFLVITAPFWLVLFIQAAKDIILFILKVAVVLVIAYLVYIAVTGKDQVCIP